MVGGSSVKQTFVGTVTYMSPERIEGQPHSSNSDVWSYGLTVVELALGRYPYFEKSPNKEVKKNKGNRGKSGDKYLEEIMNHFYFYLTFSLSLLPSQPMSFFDLLCMIKQTPSPSLSSSFSSSLVSFCARCLEKNPSLVRRGERGRGRGGSFRKRFI